MAGPNDNNAFEGPKENAPAISRTGMGGQQAFPSQHTKWDDGTGPRTTVRPMDAMMAASPAQECQKCGFKTHIEPDFSYHMKKIGGLTKCERQRASFGTAKTCSTCDGSGETATGVCSTCRGMGKTIVRNQEGPASVDADAIAAKVSEALAPSLNAIAEGLKALAVTNARAVKPKKQRKGNARGSSGLDRAGAPKSRPAPQPPMESSPEPLGDPAPGAEAPE